MINQS